MVVWPGISVAWDYQPSSEQILRQLQSTCILAKKVVLRSHEKTAGCGSTVGGCWSCREGKFIREMAALPLAEDIPIAFNSCRQGPRGLDWRDDKPAEIYWAECQVRAHGGGTGLLQQAAGQVSVMN